MYAITYTISGYASGSWNTGIGGSDMSGVRSSGNQTYTDYFYYSGGNSILYIVGSGSFSITNISVKQATANNTNALPTSAAGIAPGGVWVDTSSGNVLKVVQ
jgi:hypothetical protein